MTLPEFLLARIAEDEASMSAYDDGVMEANDGVYPLAEFHGAARVLRECDAKRRVVGIYAFVELSEGLGGQVPLGGAGPEVYWEVCQYLALPYADHPDYREEWRP